MPGKQGYVLVPTTLACYGRGKLFVIRVLIGFPVTNLRSMRTALELVSFGYSDIFHRCEQPRSWIFTLDGLCVFRMDIRLGCDKNEFVDGMNRGYMPYFPPAMIQHSQTSSFVLPEYKQVLPQRSSQREESSNEDGTAHYSGLSAMSKPSPENSMPSPSSATSSSSPASSQASSDAGGSDGAGGNKRKGNCLPHNL